MAGCWVQPLALIKVNRLGNSSTSPNSDCCPRAFSGSDTSNGTQCRVSLAIDDAAKKNIVSGLEPMEAGTKHEAQSSNDERLAGDGFHSDDHSSSKFLEGSG